MTIKSDRWIIDKAIEGMITPFEPHLVRKITRLSNKPSNEPPISIAISKDDYQKALVSDTLDELGEGSGGRSGEKLGNKIVEDSRDYTELQPLSIPIVTSVFHVISYGTSSYGYDLRLSPKEFKVFKHVPGTVVSPKSFSIDNLEDCSLKEDEEGQYFIIPANSYALGVALERLEIPRNITVLVIGKSTYCRCGIIVNVSPIESEWRGHLTLEFSNSSSTDCKLFANEGICQLLFFESDDSCQESYNDRNGKYQNQKHEITLPIV